MKYTAFVEVIIERGPWKHQPGRNKLICRVFGRLNYHWVYWINPLGRVSLGLLQRDVKFVQASDLKSVAPNNFFQ